MHFHHNCNLLPSPSLCSFGRVRVCIKLVAWIRSVSWRLLTTVYWPSLPYILPSVSLTHHHYLKMVKREYQDIEDEDEADYSPTTTSVKQESIFNEIMTPTSAKTTPKKKLKSSPSKSSKDVDLEEEGNTPKSSPAKGVSLRFQIARADTSDGINRKMIFWLEWWRRLLRIISGQLQRLMGDWLVGLVMGFDIMLWCLYVVPTLVQILAQKWGWLLVEAGDWEGSELISGVRIEQSRTSEYITSSK